MYLRPMRDSLEDTANKGLLFGPEEVVVVWKVPPDLIE